jgi:hypothetical protein
MWDFTTPVTPAGIFKPVILSEFEVLLFARSATKAGGAPHLAFEMWDFTTPVMRRYGPHGAGKRLF